MNNIALILNTIEDKIELKKNNYFFKSTSKITLIFIAKQKWISFNNSRNLLDSMEVVQDTMKINRKNIIKYLNEVESSIKEINRNAEIVKIVIFGEEKYKISRCLQILKIQMCIFMHKKRNLFNYLFSKPIYEWVSLDLCIPVVLIS